MRWLITGVTGFVGQHMVAELKGEEVFGLTRQAKPDRSPDLTIFSCDWYNPEELRQKLAFIQPDAIIHLAGYASNGKAFREPDAAFAGNVTVTKALLDGVLAERLACRVLIPTTGLVYGEGAGSRPFREDDPLQPLGPYAQSKAIVDQVAEEAFRLRGMDTIRARPFNHIGPGQSADYAFANFARQLAAAEFGLQPAILQTGDLSAHRDLCDVRDVVHGYRLLVENANAGEVYNIGSGQTFSIRSLLQEMLQLTAVPMQLQEQKDPARSTDTQASQADIGKIKALGWEPKIPLSRTLEDILNDWRLRYQLQHSTLIA